MSNANKRLFKPTKLGAVQLKHRVALAPLTRFRAPDHIPVARHAEYYQQRASDGGLLITEATFISADAGGYLHVPGIWSREQIAGWKKVTEAVHAKGGFIYCQLWNLGRANKGDQDVKRVVGPSNIPFEGGATPEPLTVAEILEFVEKYRQAALNSIEAGFDGVEVHNANGYKLNQFLEASSNVRTDEYGGSMENRARFTFQVLDTVTKAIGQERVGIRFSPFGTFQGMGKMSTEETYELYTYVLERIRSTYPNLAYVHLVEDSGAWLNKKIDKARSLDPFREIFRKPVKAADDYEGNVFGETGEDGNSNIAFISCGDYHTETAVPHVEAKNDIVAVGRRFIANPDLPWRMEHNKPLTPYDRSTFYTPLSDQGYIDYAVFGERGHGEKAAEARL